MQLTPLYNFDIIDRQFNHLARALHSITYFDMKFFIGSVLWIAGLHLVSSATLVPHPDANLKTVNVSGMLSI